MADYYALTSKPLPKRLLCKETDFSIRVMSQAERIAIEDYLFNKEIKITLDPATTAVVVSQSLMYGATAEDFAVLIEFALGMLTISGFLPIEMFATLGSSGCFKAFPLSSVSS